MGWSKFLEIFTKTILVIFAIALIFGLVSEYLKNKFSYLFHHLIFSLLIFQQFAFFFVYRMHLPESLNVVIGQFLRYYLKPQEIIK